MYLRGLMTVLRRDESLRLTKIEVTSCLVYSMRQNKMISFRLCSRVRISILADEGGALQDFGRTLQDIFDDDST